MAFAVICKSCQARFLLNDDLLRRKVAGKVVTVRCRQCHATIEVDASDVDPKRLSEVEKTALLPAPPAPPEPQAPTPMTFKALRPAPSPPRPAAKSTLMGIGVPKPAGATELVALSPGLLGVGGAAPAAKLDPRGFPEPPPPPPVVGSVIETLDADDWEITETPPRAQADAAPESVDDFIEELPPSLPPEAEAPSSSGTPSLKVLTQHDEPAQQPRVDDFLANMTAAMNGGIMMGAPTIDVSQLSPAATSAGPSIDMSAFDIPISGKKTLPLFGVDDGNDIATLRPPPGELDETPTPMLVAPATLAAPARPAAAAPLAAGSLSPTALEPKPPSSAKPRQRRNVIAPATTSVPPPAPERQRSLLAAPLLLALAAAAGFLIWKRGAAPASGESLTRSEQHTPPVARAPATAVPPVAPTEPAVAPAPLEAAPTAPADDITFEVVKAPPARVTREQSVAEPATPTPRADAKPEPEPKPEPTKPVTKDEPQPERPAREPAAEPAGPFDRAAAVAALNSSAGQASACRKEGDPSGVASVIITFAPSGRVTSANISGPPFAGTATGGCIASALRKARVPAFEGERVTVSKTVVIQ